MGWKEVPRITPFVIFNPFVSQRKSRVYHNLSDPFIDLNIYHSPLILKIVIIIGPNDQFIIYRCEIVYF